MGAPPADLKLRLIHRKRGYSTEQVNASCGGCHAKALPITAAFVPGNEFAQHYDLVTLEDPDFYPDGRDLGENYTYAGWMMNRCAQSGQLDCTYCHTSSGRYRFANPAKANDACLPCHEALVKDSGAHSHHKAGGEGDRCVACHMPETSFGPMRRSDHSMRAPMPAATLAFGSPNACTICHADKDVTWANTSATEWYGAEYQQETLRTGGLIAAARAMDWQRLDEMLAYLKTPARDDIVAASLVRLLRSCGDARKGPVLETLAVKDPSPLVRARAAEALGDALTEGGLKALLVAVLDPVRLVRIRAAASLAPVDPERLEKPQGDTLRKANAEFIAAMQARPDDFSSYYNLGVFYTACGALDQAISAYETSLKLRPDAIATLVNAGLAYYTRGNLEKAETCLKKAREAAPESPLVCVNLALLYGEQGRLDEAAALYAAALEFAPDTPDAAYNLAIIRGKQGKLEEAVQYAQKAWELLPENPNYVQAYAFYLRQTGHTEEAQRVLQGKANIK